MAQAELSKQSGVGLTPLKRFEKTGRTTLLNLVAMFRGLNLLDRIEDFVPKPDAPGPLKILEAERAKLRQRQRAPRASHRVRKEPIKVENVAEPSPCSDFFE